MNSGWVYTPISLEPTTVGVALKSEHELKLVNAAGVGLEEADELSVPAALHQQRRADVLV